MHKNCLANPKTPPFNIKNKKTNSWREKAQIKCTHPFTLERWIILCAHLILISTIYIFALLFDAMSMNMNECRAAGKQKFNSIEYHAVI